MYSFFIVLHSIICFLLIVSVLMQSGKSGGFQGIFGSSGEVIFSTPSGSSFMRKISMGLALGFGITSLALTVMTKQRMYRSVIFEQQVPAPQVPGGDSPGRAPAQGATPAQPETAPPQPEKK